MADSAKATEPTSRKNPALTYTVEEAADLLGIGRSLCYELAKQDALPVRVLHLGKRVVVPRKPLNALLSIDEAS